MASLCGTDDLLLKFEIEQALFRYARGVDRKDWALVRSAYHPDATDAHGEYEGDIDGFIDYLVSRHENIEHSAHMITNIIVEMVEPDTALVESYYLCYQRYAPGAQAEKAFSGVATEPGQALQLTALGRYIDRFERRDGRWLIAGRKVTFDILKAETAGRVRDDSPMLSSRRDHKDVLWQEKISLGLPLGQ